MQYFACDRLEYKLSCTHGGITSDSLVRHCPNRPICSKMLSDGVITVEVTGV